MIEIQVELVGGPLDGQPHSVPTFPGRLPSFIVMPASARVMSTYRLAGTSSIGATPRYEHEGDQPVVLPGDGRWTG